jgi:hypothetical protein
MDHSMEARVQRLQRHLGVNADGVLGVETLSAVERAFKLDAQPEPGPGLRVAIWPDDNEAALREFFGKPGEDNLVSFTLPYPMKLYTRNGQPVTRSRCHAKVKDSLCAVLEELHQIFGQDRLEFHGLDVFGGIYNYRTMRGGSSLSRHSWGIAIDLNPDENAMQTPWKADRVGQPGWATMPTEAIATFEKHGWKSGARAWGKDAMHFQATR